MLGIQSIKQLQNSGLQINQGCNLKWKLGDKQSPLAHPASLMYQVATDDSER